MFDDDENKERKSIMNFLNSMNLDDEEKAERIHQMVNSPFYQEGYSNGVKETEVRLETHYKDIIRTLSTIIAENSKSGNRSF